MNNALICKNKKCDKLKHDHCSFLISVSVEVISKKMFNYEILPIIYGKHPNLKKKYKDNNISVKPKYMLIEYLDQLLEDEQEKDKTTKDIQHPVLKSNMLVMGYEDIDENNKENVIIALNIPGGKRRLGEKSKHGALRELEEETSIIFTQKQYKAYTFPSNKLNFVSNYIPTPFFTFRHASQNVPPFSNNTNPGLPTFVYPFKSIFRKWKWSKNSKTSKNRGTCWRCSIYVRWGDTIQSKI